MKRIISLALSVVMVMSLCFQPAQADAGQTKPAAYPEDTAHTLRALAQGETNEDAYTHQDALFTTDMVHNNPGLEPYTSNYNDSEFLASRGYDGHVFFLYDCAQYGLLWDEFDALKGATGQNKVYPEGSTERAWAEAKKAALTEKYNAAKAAGLKVYFMMDIIVVPTRLRTLYPEILTSGKIDIEKAETKPVLDALFEEMFTQFPQIDGVYFRYGETYTGPAYGASAPYHTGNNPILNGESTHIFLINYLCDKFYGDAMVDEKPRDVVYRTWGFGGFQNSPTEYLRVSNAIEPHDNLYFCIKHSTGDFHRTVAFNQTINIGSHQQIVEVQAAREYEGKGAFPNYIGDGVINGFEEYEWLISDPTEAQSLRDVINQENLVVKGIWTWSRGGGWNGPYINGVNGIVGDTASDNKQEDVPDGSELWNDLNAYVVTQWAKDTSKTDKYYVLQYAKDVLGMHDADAESFYKLCILSSRAVLLGRARDDARLTCNTWWMRDQGINSGNLSSNIRSNVDKGLMDLMLAEQAESTALWLEMIDLAEGLDDALFERALIDSPVSVKEYIITTCKYGYYLFGLFEQMHIAGAYKYLGDKNGTYDAEKITTALAAYDRLWVEWEELFATAPGCPTLYAKEDKAYRLLGYSSNRGLDAGIAGLRPTLSGGSAVFLRIGESAALNISYTYGTNPSFFDIVSSNEAIASISAEGKVVGVAPGVARITVTVKGTAMQAAYLVSVVDEVVQEPRYVSVWEESFDDAGSVSLDKWTEVAGGDCGGVLAWNADGTMSLTSPAKGRSNMQQDLGRAFTGELIYRAEVSVSAAQNDFLVLRDSAGTVLTQVDFRKDGAAIHLNHGGATIDTGGRYETNTVYLVELAINTDSQTFTLTVTNKETGVVLVNAFPRGFRSDSAALATNVARVEFGSRGKEGVLTVDNLVLLQNQVPSAPLDVWVYDFSVDSASAWTGDGTTTWNQEEQSITVTGNSGEKVFELPEEFSGNIVVNFKMKIDSIDHRGFFRLAGESKKHINQIEFRGSANTPRGQIVMDIGDGNNMPQLSAYTANTFYDVEMRINTATREHSVSVNGGTPLNLIGYKEAPVGSPAITQIHIASRNNAKFTIADLKIARIPTLDLSAETVAATIDPSEITFDGQRLVLPAMPEGYTLSVTSTDPAGLFDAAGNYLGTREEKITVAVTLTVTKTLDTSTAALAPIAIEVLPLATDSIARGSIRTPGGGDLGDPVAYILSMQDMTRVMNIRVRFEVDGNMLTGNGLELLREDFAAMDGGSGVIRWTEKGGGIWQGELLLLYLGGPDGLTLDAETDIARLIFAAKQYGAATLTLTELLVTGLNDDGVGVTLDSAIAQAEATATVAKVYSKYDLNRDGVIDARDLAMAQRYYMVKEGDANWTAASVCDFNNDKLVDMLDLIDLYRNFTP